ncbi:hypothetical protein ACWGI8_20935 [Streptomyces sp. NPDC054841]
MAAGFTNVSDGVPKNTNDNDKGKGIDTHGGNPVKIAPGPIDPKSQDSHKNNNGISIDQGTNLYDGWSWKEIQVAILGAVDTDSTTTTDAQYATSDPVSLSDAAAAFSILTLNLTFIDQNLSKQTQLLLDAKNGLWKGNAAAAFSSLMEKFRSVVKSRLQTLMGPPTYAEALMDAAQGLTTAIRRVYEANHKAANNALARNAKYVTFQDKTQLVAVSQFKDIVEDLTKDMRFAINELANSYRAAKSSMPEPQGITYPGVTSVSPEQQKLQKDLDDLNTKLDKAHKDSEKARAEADKANKEAMRKAQDSLKKGQTDLAKQQDVMQKAAGADAKGLGDSPLPGAPGTGTLGNGLGTGLDEPGAGLGGDTAGGLGGVGIPPGALPNPGLMNSVRPPRAGGLLAAGTLPKVGKGLSAAELQKGLPGTPLRTGSTIGGGSPARASTFAGEAGAAARAASSRATMGTAAGGSPGMMPGGYPMGGMGGMGAGMGGMGSAQPREKDSNTWLVEDEETWGIDDEEGPTALGRR